MTSHLLLIDMLSVDKSSLSLSVIILKRLKPWFCSVLCTIMHIVLYQITVYVCDYDYVHQLSICDFCIILA